MACIVEVHQRDDNEQVAHVQRVGGGVEAGVHDAADGWVCDRVFRIEVDPISLGRSSNGSIETLLSSVNGTVEVFGSVSGYGANESTLLQ